MAFQEYSEQRRLRIKDQEHYANRVNELAYLYIDAIFSCDASAGCSAPRSEDADRWRHLSDLLLRVVVRSAVARLHAGVPQSNVLARDATCSCPGPIYSLCSYISYKS